MPVRFGIIADDLSGGMNIGVEFSSAGFQTLLVHDMGRVSLQSDVLICDTETRSDSPDAAYRKTSAAAQALRQHTPDVVVKKIDSLLRGQIGMEIAAIRDVFGFEKCLLIAASPKLGRKTTGGYQYVGSYLLEMVHSQVDPTSTVTGSNVGAILSAQTPLPVDLIDLGVVRQGVQAVQTKIAESDASILVSDCMEQADLDLVVEAAYAMGIRFFAGTYGLGESLVRLSQVRDRPVLFVVGSLSAAAYLQVNHLIDQLSSKLVRIEYDESFLELPLETFAEGYRSQLQTGLTGSECVVLQVAGLPDQVEKLWQYAAERGLGREDVSQRIDALLRYLVEPLLANVSGFVATGGSTAHSLFTQLHAQALRLEVQEVLPGTPGARVVNGPYDGMPFVAKPGSQGDEDALVRLARYVQKASIQH